MRQYILKQVSEMSIAILVNNQYLNLLLHYAFDAFNTKSMVAFSISALVSIYEHWQLSVTLLSSGAHIGITSDVDIGQKLNYIT